MNLYLSKTHSDEDDDEPVQTGKFGIINGTKNEILKLCGFFKSIEKHLKNNDNCHMHLRDYLDQWNAEKDIDIEINVDL